MVHREHVHEVHHVVLPPTRARLFVVAPQLCLARIARRPVEVLGERQDLLHQVLADDPVVLVEPEAHRLAVEHLVLDGAMIDLLGAHVADRAAAELLRAGRVERVQARAGQLDAIRPRGTRRGGEDQRARDEELQEPALAGEAQRGVHGIHQMGDVQARSWIGELSRPPGSQPGVPGTTWQS